MSTHFYISKRYEGGRWTGVPEFKLLCTGEFSKEDAYSTYTKIDCIGCLELLVIKYEGILLDLTTRLANQSKKEGRLSIKSLENIRQQPCCNCNAPAPSDPNHIKTRGAGGTDDEWNLLPMCRRCHTAWHAMGWYTFITINKATWFRLEQLGWEIDLSITMKPMLRHPKLVAFSKRTQ